MQELWAGGPNPPQLASEVQSQTLMESRRHVAPLPHHLDPSLRGETPQSPQPSFKWRTGQLAKMQAQFEATTQTASAIALVVKLTNPIIPPDWTEEKQYILVVTTLVRSLNLEMTSVILGDTVTASAGGGAFQNPHIEAVLPGPIWERGAIHNQGATMKELGKNDAEWELLCNAGCGICQLSRG